MKFMPTYPTPHINAAPGDFAKTVLMPGDPLRSQYIAENYFENATPVNNVRGVRGYTGTYDGIPISVMASGMGIPSMGIYSHELYTVFGVENIIRIGSAGSVSKDVKLRDIVIAQGASYDSAFARHFHLPGTFAPLGTYELLKTADDIATDMKIRHHVGALLTSDTFYDNDDYLPEYERKATAFARMGVLAVEMETAGLYMTAAECSAGALSICTISDSIVTGEALSSAERQETFDDMIKLALAVACKIHRP